MAASSPAQAQNTLAAFVPPVPPPPPPPPPPKPSLTDTNSNVSAQAGVINLGSNFLEQLGKQASNGFDAASRSNPGGGGASAATAPPLWRTWGEAYGISARTDAQGTFLGDRRQTWGDVAGVGMQVAPGVNVGLSVDQSRTAIDVPLALQSATLDLTQIGFNASVDHGPWTWAMALVHGFGQIGANRGTSLGLARANYGAVIDGALTEISYFWTMDQSRIVPKAAFEYVHAETDAYQEFGGLNPVTTGAGISARTRILLGAEVGHYWIFDRKVFDLSAYGKFVDNVSQTFNNVIVSLGSESIALQGIGESRYGADAGASASLSLNNNVRLYLNYDGKYRAALQSHQGTAGIEFKW